ncbi:hypothetical protein L4174_022380 [Photobacterium sp. CCB-ST2H9]|uniref:hypothetical protein n=1 Tax=Photobacterium sp. CCB-ST2H9 TaxID=2912855 RepID=UPI002005D61B|nr:hypothetical protein [Photobacterium sp. CCB-ST2H9]UTM59447.1 hypothetical protein L4174_022380 [Photobacterium sp. CCB-ST2H9]
MFKKSLAVGIVAILAGCSSSPYQYYEESTSIEKGITKYQLNDVNLKLTLGHGAIPGDTTFASESKLKEEFYAALLEEMNKQGVLSNNNDKDAIQASISIQYQRNFNYGGKALNKPAVSHEVVVQRNGKRLASFQESGYTTKYAYFEDAAVSLEIASFQWGAEDEPRDIQMISKLIIEELSELGK